MNPQLLRLAAKVGLEAPGQEGLRRAFGLACAQRVRHLLEEPRIVELLDQGLAGGTDPTLAEEAAALARSHPGSKSIDGAAHAAVSASHAVARALAGRAIDAADYAAYAAVYAYAATAVNDPSAFESEHRWQVETLSHLADG